MRSCRGRAPHVCKQTGRQVHPVDQTDFGLVSQIVARDLCQGAGSTHHLDQAKRWVLLVQGLPAQSELGQGRWTKRGQQHIGFGQDFVQCGLARWCFEVERQVLDPFVHEVVAAGRVVLHRVTRRWIDFGASGAHLGQPHQCGRAGQVEGKTQDARTAQGFGGAHSAPYCRSPQRGLTPQNSAANPRSFQPWCVNRLRCGSGNPALHLGIFGRCRRFRGSGASSW
jgi:hypothetical protein